MTNDAIRRNLIRSTIDAHDDDLDAIFALAALDDRDPIALINDAFDPPADDDLAAATRQLINDRNTYISDSLFDDYLAESYDKLNQCYICSETGHIADNCPNE